MSPLGRPKGEFRIAQNEGTAVSELARLHQIHGAQPVLQVADVREAAEWFCCLLGFTLDFLHGEPPMHGRVKLGDGSWGAPVYIHLSRTSAPVQQGTEIRLHVGHDIDGLYRHVLASGGKVLQAPTDQPWGLREMVVEGPAGHVLVLGAQVHAQPANAMPRTVIACYRPRPGQEAALTEIVRSHVPALRALGLATDRAPYSMRAADGTLVEVFEWASAAAIEAAHTHPEVHEMWAAFAAAGEHVKLSELAETQKLFAEFTPLHP